MHKLALNIHYIDGLTIPTDWERVRPFRLIYLDAASTWWWKNVCVIGQNNCCDQSPISVPMPIRNLYVVFVIKTLENSWKLIHCTEFPAISFLCSIHHKACILWLAYCSKRAARRSGLQSIEHVWIIPYPMVQKFYILHKIKNGVHKHIAYKNTIILISYFLCLSLIISMVIYWILIYDYFSLWIIIFDPTFNLNVSVLHYIMLF